MRASLHVCRPCPYRLLLAMTAALGALDPGGALALPPAEDGVFPSAQRLSRQAQPPMAAPSLGAWERFEDLGTRVTRASETPHHYAKTCPWNADERYALLVDGTLLDGRTFRRLRKLTVPAEHRTWANANPDIIYGVARTGRKLDRWVKVSAATGRMTTLARYPEYRRVSYGKYEGNTDNRDTWALLVGDDVTPFLIEARTGRKQCEVPSRGKVSDTTVSQDGRYLLVNWERLGVDAYDTSCRFIRQVSSVNSHYDACVLPDGVTQVVVQPSRRDIVAIGIADGARTVVYSDSAQRIHVSCRNVRRPGYAYVSSYGGGGRGDRVTLAQRLWQRGFSVRLDGSQQVEVFAWLHAELPVPYEGEPSMVPSRSGHRVWWKVDWDGASGRVQSFVAEATGGSPSGSTRPRGPRGRRSATGRRRWAGSAP